RRTFLSNLFSVQSDCPHREKFGYGGDLVATAEAFAWNFDMATFYAKVAQDFADAQRPNGGFTETAPFVGIADEGLGDGAGPVEWGTALPLLCRDLGDTYGDWQPARQHLDRVLRWNDLLRRRARDGTLENALGDHEALTPRHRAVSGTAFLHDNALIAVEL